MKKFLLAASTIAFTAVATWSADAADIALRKAAPLAPPPPSWTGCYVEGGGGYGLWNADHNFQTNTTSTTPSTSGGRGGFGTVGGGCDYQFSPASGWGNWVVGVFADYDFMNLHRTLQETIVSGDAKESSAWGVGGRIGYLVTPNVFTYINGGYTETRFDQINFSLDVIAPGTPVSFVGAHTYHGGFVGAGTEIALSGFLGLPLPAGLFWRSEYRFATYNGATLPVFATSGAPLTIFGANAVENFKPYVQTISSSLVYRFNWLGH
jgi:outer membrane immunogenic protein